MSGLRALCRSPGPSADPRPGILDAGLFGAVTLMVVVTTFLTPPLLKWRCKDGHWGERI
jgi:hypothetical protein